MGIGPIVVVIDIEIKDLIPGFIENRRTELLLLKTAITNIDYNTLQMIGHRLKGSSGGYGFSELGEWGLKLEIAAIAEDIDTSQTCVEKIDDYLNRIVIEFREAS